MVQDPANAVLRDFENLIWLALIIGLAGAGIWRFFRPRPAGDVGMARPPGVPADSFTGADLFVLPMVMIKYSVALQVAAVALFTLPDLFLEWLDLAPASPEVPAEENPRDPEDFQVTATLIGMNWVLNLMLVSLVMVMVQWVGRRDPSEVFGLRRQRWEWILLYVVVGVVVAVPLAMTMKWLSHEWLETVFGGGGLSEQEAVQSIRETEESPLVRGMLIFDACLIAPVVEEVVFRGYLYGVLKRFTGPIFAATVSASLFATAHNNLPAVLPLLVFALLLIVFYERSRSLWVPIIIHSLFNITQVFLLLGPFKDGEV